MPDILDALADVDMHAIQTSGNCIRNVTTDEFAGVAADEHVDPRPYCELIRQWSTSHPEFDWLPRKFKIAVTGSPNDRAVTKAHDIGLRMVRNDAGEPGFEVIVGGGLGRLLGVGDRLGEQVRQPLVLTHLDLLGVDEDEAHVVGRFEGVIEVLEEEAQAHAQEFKLQ